jgi:hypothetical protein
MIGISVTEKARAAYAGWRIGLLQLEGLLPREGAAALDLEAERVEEGLKSRLAGLGRREIAALEPARRYAAHFSRSGKAYPVVLQAEAVASKGRKIAMPDPLVRAMFAAELESMLLFAGHDIETLRGPLSLDLASGAESMPTLGGTEKIPPAGDLIMRDAEGIVASVLLGPDARTSIGPSTGRVLFAVYSPPGVQASVLRGGLDRLAALAFIACRGARIEDLASMDLLPGQTEATS